MIDSPLVALDVAWGMVVGLDSGIAPLTGLAVGEPLEALRQCMVEALCRPPCVVSFSGGRDSSALLALAVDVARREGLELPVPATVYFSDVAAAEETPWQQELIAHLRLREWSRTTVGDELELLGDGATGALGRHGLRYPPNLHFHEPILRVARGGSLISGIGGDELLTPTVGARASLLHAGVAAFRPRDVLNMALWAAPAWMRGRWLTYRSVDRPSWLRPEALRLLRSAVRHWMASQPMSFDRYLTDWWWRSRYFQHGKASLALLAADYGVIPVFPFMDERVLLSLASRRRSVGFSSRAAAMEWLFGGLLPDRVIKRATKAAFDAVLVGPLTREFARRWDGRSGIDEQLVDGEALRRQWSGDNFDVRSMLLLQAAWLATEQTGVAGHLAADARAC